MIVILEFERGSLIGHSCYRLVSRFGKGLFHSSNSLVEMSADTKSKRGAGIRLNQSSPPPVKAKSVSAKASPSLLEPIQSDFIVAEVQSLRSALELESKLRISLENKLAAAVQELDVARSKSQVESKSAAVSAGSASEEHELSSEMRLSRELLIITRERDQLLRALEAERTQNKSSPTVGRAQLRSPHQKRKDSKEYVLEKFQGIGKPKPEVVRASSPFRSHGKAYTVASHLLPIGYEDWKSRIPSLSQLAIEDAIQGQAHLINLLTDELEGIKRSSKSAADQHFSKVDKLVRTNAELVLRVRKLESENGALHNHLKVENEEIDNLSQYFSVKLAETLSKSKTQKSSASPLLMPKEPDVATTSPLSASRKNILTEPPPINLLPDSESADVMAVPLSSNDAIMHHGLVPEVDDVEDENHYSENEFHEDLSFNDNEVTFEDDPEILEKYNSETVGFEVAEWGHLYTALADYDISCVRSSDRSPMKPSKNSVFRCVLAGSLSRDQFMSVMSQGLSAMSTKARLRFLAEFFSEIRSAATVMKFQQTLLDLPGDEMDLVSLCQLLIGKGVALANAAGGRILLRQEDQFILIADNLDESVARQQEAKVIEKTTRSSETIDAVAGDGVSYGFPNGPGSSFTGSNAFAKLGTVMETYFAGPVLPFEGIAAEVCRSGQAICLLEPARSPFFSRSVDLQYPYRSVAVIVAPLFDDKHETVVGTIILYAEPLIPHRKGDDGLPDIPLQSRRKTNFTREDEILSAAFAAEAGKEFKQCTQYAESWRMQQLCQKFSTYSPMLETKDEMGSIFSAFSSQLQMLTEAEDVCLFLINEDGETAWKLFASSNQGPEPNVSVKSGIVKMTISRAQLCVVSDLHHPYFKTIDPSVDLCPGKKIQNLSNIISYPMIQGDGSVYGVIQVVNSGMRRVHVEVIATIAAQLEGTLLNSKVPLSLKESFSSQVAHGSQLAIFNPTIASTLTGLVLNELCRLLNVEIARVLLVTVAEESAPLTRSNANGCFCFCSNSQPSLASLEGCTPLPLAGRFTLQTK